MNIKQIKERDGRGYNQLARDSGVGVAVVWRVINGHTRRPSAQTVAKLAAGLGVGIDEIIEALKEQKDEGRNSAG